MMRVLAKIEPGFSRAAVIAFGSVITGVAIVMAPPVAWLLLCAVGGLLLLQVPVYLWVGAAVLSATLSRLFVATGFVPTFINFVHFPLALGAAFIAMVTGAARNSLLRSIAFGVVSFLLLSLFSWLLNGGEFLRPPLTWLVFSEPFLIIYAILSTAPSVSECKFLWRLVLGISFLQLPLAVWQALNLGLSDYVQGTFVGMGAGHHVAGGVTLLATLVCVARSLSANTSIRRFSWLLGGVLLFTFPILSDAKQAVAAFLPALLLVIFMFSRIRWTSLAGALPLLSAAIVAAFLYYPPLRWMFDWDLVSQGLRGKIEAFAVIAGRASDTPGGWLLGLGPGNSVSRVGLLSIESYVRSKSPVPLLGLSAAPTTQEILALSRSDQLLGSSSAWSGISSWLGLFGDLGLIGLGLYLWISWKLWQNLGKSRRWEVAAAKAALVMAGLLGAVYSWLEEPGFTLMIALVVGLGLTANVAKDASVQNSARPQFLSTARR